MERLSVCFTCVLRWTDAVAVTLFVHGARHSGRSKPPVGAERVCGDLRVRTVQRPLASIAASCSRPRFSRSPCCGV